MRRNPALHPERLVLSRGGRLPISRHLRPIVLDLVPSPPREPFHQVPESTESFVFRCIWVRRAVLSSSLAQNLVYHRIVEMDPANIAKFLYHPFERDLRKAGLGIWVTAPDIGMHSWKPDLLYFFGHYGLTIFHHQIRGEGDPVFVN